MTMGISLTCECCGNSPTVTPRPPWPKHYFCPACRLNAMNEQDSRMKDEGYDSPVKYPSIRPDSKAKTERLDEIDRMVKIGIGDR